MSSAKDSLRNGTLLLFIAKHVVDDDDDDNEKTQILVKISNPIFGVALGM